MRAGLLNEVIHILSCSISTNRFGEEEEAWTEKYVTRAQLLHNGGNRVNQNGEIVYTHAKTFKVRHYVPVTELDHILWNNTEYRIINIVPDSAKQNLTITVEQVND